MSTTTTTTTRYPAVAGSHQLVTIHMDAIAGFHLEDLDFSADLKVNDDKVITISKAQMIRVDADNYLAPLDTSGMDSGRLYAYIKAWIPDGNFPGNKRLDISKCDTHITIIH